MSLLSKRIASHLSKVVGSKSVGVTLLCFEYEINATNLENLPFYFGGEVILNFEHDKAVITWDENAGWKDHFSLYVGSDRHYLPTSSLVRWNVSKLKPWCNYIDRNLISTQVYG